MAIVEWGSSAAWALIPSLDVRNQNNSEILNHLQAVIFMN